MNQDIILACPVCQNKLFLDGHSYKCSKKHTFDIGKVGYVNLILNSSQSAGDDKQMILARNAFLEKGYYQSIANKLIELIDPNRNNTILDAGCGEGYYLDQLYKGLSSDKSGYYGFDISKMAVQVAAKRNSNITWFVGNAFHIPVENHSIDYFLSMFSFYSPSEVERVLKRDGTAILFRAGINHLIELKTILYNELTLKESNHEFPTEQFEIEKQNLNTQITVNSNEDLEHLLLMTPHYWKTKLENKEQLKLYNELRCTIDVDIYLIRKK